MPTVNVTARDQAGNATSVIKSYSVSQSRAMLVGASPVAYFDDLDVQVRQLTPAAGKTVNKGLAFRQHYGDINADFMQSLAGGNPAKGIATGYSWDGVSPAQVNSGALDGKITSFFNTSVGLVDFLFSNEFDNHNPPDDYAAAAPYRAAVKRIWELKQASNCDNDLVRVGPSLMGYAYQRLASGGGAYYRNFYPFGANDTPQFDLIGCHNYDRWQPPGTPNASNYKTQTLAYYFGEVRDFSNQYDIPVSFGELGLHPDPARPNYRSERWDSWMEYFGTFWVRGVAYFHHYKGDKGPWWADEIPHTGLGTAETNESARSQGGVDTIFLETLRKSVAAGRSFRV